MKNSIKFFLQKRKFPDSKIYFNASVDNKSKLGKHSVIFSNVTLVNSTIDDYSYVQKNTEIVNAQIGKFCSIASNVAVGLANHPMNLISTSPIFYDNTQPLPFFFTTIPYKGELSPQTTIGSDVWIGQGAMIKAGITLGVGAVIGAGAVVTKNVEPYSVVAGVPARHIKYRFDEKLRELLLKSKWWELDEKIVGLSLLFNQADEFLEKLGRNG
ncbi:CatB-related O-acetyltransferase [uncultured Sulfurimonas sp.]|nr:CatB-related O-acetyltransferase [Sulfurimonas sp.]